MEIYNDTAYKSFKEVTPGALDGKEGFLVELAAGNEQVQLATSGANAIGVMAGKLQNGTLSDGAVRVRLLGKGGTVKVRAGGIIAKGARVIWGAGGKVLTIPAAAATYRTLGRKLTDGNSADNDVIEILDVVEPVVVT